MGIGSWFGFGSKEERAEDTAARIPRVPTSQDLLGAIDQVEQQARAGKVPGMVQSRLGRVARIVRTACVARPFVQGPRTAERGHRVLPNGGGRQT